MIYVFDTNSLSVLRNYYPATFPTLWGNIESATGSGSIQSVHEVSAELELWNDAAFIETWAKQHKDIFAKPSDAELLAVQKILAFPHFQSLISQQALLKGKPVADPFVVAAAMVKGGTVVTEEQLKPNAAKIPNVCDHFRVPFIDLEGFLKHQGWTF